MAKTLEHLTAGEAKFVRAYVREILSHGLSISVNDGDEWVVKKSTNAQTILAAMGSVGSEWVVVRDAAGEKLGAMFFVYGNDDNGGEVLADYSCTLEPYVAKTFAKAVEA